MSKTTQMTEKRCYSVSDLQEMLEISKPAVYELIKRKEFHWVMIGGRKEKASTTITRHTDITRSSALTD